MQSPTNRPFLRDIWPDHSSRVCRSWGEVIIGSISSQLNLQHEALDFPILALLHSRSSLSSLLPHIRSRSSLTLHFHLLLFSDEKGREAQKGSDGGEEILSRGCVFALAPSFKTNGGGIFWRKASQRRGHHRSCLLLLFSEIIGAIFRSPFRPACLISFITSPTHHSPCN